MRVILALFFLSLLIAGCRHPLEIVGEGDILSETGNRDCYLEDAQSNLPNCTENTVTDAQDYDETYYGVARTGWHFHRWAGYCVAATTNECSFFAGAQYLTSLQGLTMPALKAIFRPDVITGFDSLFMGHSLFNPFSVGMNFHASEAGFVDHTQSNFFWPSEFGSPEAVWNDPVKQAQVKAVLDTGNVDLFGMTYHPVYPGMDGYRNWVSYALEKNPDTRFFIGLPWPWDPASYTSAAYATEWDSQHTVRSHQIIDTLRAEYPGVDFYCVPHGAAAVELHDLYNAGNLPDVQALVSDTVPSVFSDSHGHASSILIELGQLVWLGAIYGINLNAYSYSPGYTTDLNAIAQDIIDNHDANYTAP